MSKGYNVIIELSNTLYRFPVNRAVISLYDYPATITDGTVFGTPAISTDGTAIVGQLLSDNIGRYKLNNIPTGKYTAIATGVGINAQVLVGYEDLDIGWGSDVTGSDVPYKDNTNISIADKIAQLEGNKFLSYVCILNQVGTSNPVATEFDKSIGEIVWSRLSNGVYIATSDNLFNNIIIPPYLINLVDVSGVAYRLTKTSNSILTLTTLYLGTPTDGLLVDFPLEFKITKLDNVVENTFDSYTCTLNQLETNHPVAMEFTNDVGQVIWSRISSGIFTANSDGLFTDKTFIPPYLNNLVNTVGVAYRLTKTNSSVLTLITVDSGIPTDGLLVNFPLEFKIYK